MIGTFMFIFVILLVTTPETTFVSEDSWAHLLIPLGLFLSRRYQVFYIECLPNLVVSIPQLLLYYKYQESLFMERTQ